MKKCHGCALCGKEYPIELLVAAHIKPRAKCTDDERRDVENVVMPACRFGCDELFERGYIVVDSRGKILVNPKKTQMSAPLEAYLKQFEGRQLVSVGNVKAGFFAWHLENHLG